VHEHDSARHLRLLHSRLSNTRDTVTSQAVTATRALTGIC
jgi:hypothetical protein